MFWLKISSSYLIHKSVSDNVTEEKRFYHTNYGVIQGFLVLRKDVKIPYFFTCVWYRQSAAGTSLAFGAAQSGWWMNSKAFTILNPRSFVEIFGLWLLKHWKIPIAYKQWRSNFPWRWRKPKYEKWHFMWLRTKIDNSKIFYGPILAVYLLSVRTNSKTENFVHRKLGPLFVFVVIQRMFSSWGLSILLFSLMNKVDFSCW